MAEEGAKLTVKGEEPPGATVSGRVRPEKLKLVPTREA